MKSESTDVRSGKKVVATATYNVFDSIAEAVTYFDSQADAEKEETGESLVLVLINRQHKSDEVNKARVAAVRPTSWVTQLRDKAKDPDAKAKLEAFLSEMGIEGVL